MVSLAEHGAKTHHISPTKPVWGDVFADLTKQKMKKEQEAMVEARQLRNDSPVNTPSPDNLPKNRRNFYEEEKKALPKWATEKEAKVVHETTKAAENTTSVQV